MKQRLKAFLLNYWNEPRRFCLALILGSTFVFTVAFLADQAGMHPRQPSPTLLTFKVVGVLCLAAGIATGILGLLLSVIPVFYRWQTWMLRRRFFLLACLATLIALFYAEEDWRGKHAWLSFKAKWEAKGEHFDRASLVPPPVPDEENFAAAPIVATSYGQILTLDGQRKERWDTNVINRMKMPVEVEGTRLQFPGEAYGNWQNAKAADLAAAQAYYRQAAEQTNWFPIPPQPQSPAADVLFALARYDSALDELRLAARRPHSRYPLEYDAENTPGILLPHLAPLKGCVRMLQLRACAELALGQTDPALADIRLMFRLVEAIHVEPFVISQLVRISMVQIALQPIWEGMANHQWSDVQLAALDQELKRLDFLADYRFSMRGEVIFMDIGVADFLRKHPEQIASLGDDIGFPKPAPIEALSCLMPSGWFYLNQVRGCRYMLEFSLPQVDPEQRTASPALFRQAEQVLMTELKHRRPLNFLLALMPELTNASVRFAWAQANVDLARVAAALERHRLAHGDYPASLDALAPAFLEKVPHDVIGSQPLKYHRLADGKFALYSVGWNETDDGGHTAATADDAQAGWTREFSGKVDIIGGDWVWPPLEK